MPNQPIRQANPPKPGERPKPKPRNFPMRIAGAREGAYGERVCYIGQPLTGKTTSLVTWPGLVILQWDDERTTTDTSGVQCPVIELPDWETWEQMVLPRIRTRARLQELVNEFPGFEDYQVKSLGVDSYTGMGEKCEASLRQNGNYKDMRQMYGDKLNLMRESQRVLMGVTKPTAGTPAWNLVGCVHEQVDTAMIDNKEAITDIHAAIGGQFGKNFAKDWGTFLWCFIELPKTADGTLIHGKKALYYCRTDPIDAWRRGVDRKNKLPRKVSGKYEELIEYWNT